MMTKRLLLVFPKEASEKPTVSYLVKDYNLEINIYRAIVTPNEEGYMVLDITGREQDIRNGIKFVRTLNIEVNESRKGLRWDSEKCTHCGNCLSHCPPGALYIPDIKTMKIDFNSDKCIECLNCIENCPYGACSSLF